MKEIANLKLNESHTVDIPEDRDPKKFRNSLSGRVTKLAQMTRQKFKINKEQNKLVITCIALPE